MQSLLFSSLAGSPFDSLVFYDQPNTADSLALDIPHSSIDSARPTELIQAPNSESFVLKVPAEFNWLKVSLKTDPANLLYSLGGDDHHVKGNPFLIKTAKKNGHLNLLLKAEQDKAVVGTFSFYKEAPKLTPIMKSPRSANETSAFPVPKHEPPATDLKVIFPVTLQDGPVFRATISEYEHKIPRLLSDFSKVNEANDSFENHAQHAIRSRKTLLEWVQDLENASFPNAIKKYYSRETVIDSGLITALGSVIDEPGSKLVISKVRTKLADKPTTVDTLSGKRHSFEEESKKYYEWVAKLLGSGKSKDEKFLSKRKSFELAKIDYLTYLYEAIMKTAVSFAANNEYGEALVHTYKDSSELRKLFRSTVERCRSLTELKAEMAKVSLEPPNEKSGILFVQSSQSRPGSSWHKEWVVLRRGNLVEYTDWRKGDSPRGDPIDISLCNIKPVEVDKRRTCFRVMTSTGHERFYQALDEEDRDMWVQALYDAGQQLQPEKSKNAASRVVHDAEKIRRVSSVSLVNLKIVQAISSSNLQCCDCDSTEGVEWISLNLLCIFCVHCSSCHRSLGTSVSKVRSLRLDSFDPEQSSLLQYIDNDRLNRCYEALLELDHKIDRQASDQARLQFITEKYTNRLYVDLSLVPNSSKLLIHGIRNNKIEEILQSVAAQVDLDMKVSRTQGDTTVEFTLFEYALTHPYVDPLKGKPMFDSAELLLLNGASCGESVDSKIELSDAANAYWQRKIDRYNGVDVPPVAQPVVPALDIRAAKSSSSRSKINSLLRKKK